MARLVVWVMVFLTGMAFEEMEATDSGCGSPKFQTGMNGTISSMNFPNNYISNANCEWQITVLDGYRIRLHFNQTFNVQEASDCWQDNVIVKQNGWSNGPYCGSETPTDIFTANSMARVVFKSDGTNQTSGFSIMWTAVSAEEESGCGSPKKQTGLNGTISSMNYPNHYTKWARCNWEITVPIGSRIRLNFNPPFQLESATKCQYDNMIVSDTKARMSYGPYCSNTVPPDILSYGSSLTVDFTSDGGNNREGFSLTWTREDPKMFGPNNTYTCHCEMDVQCDVNSGVCPKKCDSGWYGEYCQTGNTALGRPANQSSTKGQNTTAENAVDNGRNQKIAGGSCTLTADQPLDDQPWWRVDLGKRFALLKLTIYSREKDEQLKNLVIWMTDVADPDAAKGRVCVTYPGTVALGAKLQLTCDPPAVGRYLYIKLLDNSIALSLCEVVVHAFQYRDCTGQHFGPNCNHKCRCADQTEQCNSASGVCISRCSDDYSGQFCEKLLPFMVRAPKAPNRMRTFISVTSLHWSKQNDMGDGTVLKYRLEYKAKKSSQWTKATIEHATTITNLIWDIQGLVVNTAYQFRVILLNRRPYESDEKWGRPGSVLESWTRCPDVPVPAITNLATGIKSSLTWPYRSYLLVTVKNFTSNGMPSNCFKSFTIWYKGSSDGSFSSNTVSDRDDFQGKSENLKANTNYTVYIELQDIDGKTARSINSIKKTAEDIPGEVTNLLATKQNRTLTVTWSEPALKNGVITAYYVEHRLTGYGQCEDVVGNNPSESPALTNGSYTLPEELVCPYCRYNITVTAATGVPLVIMNQATAESKPTAWPTAPALKAVGSREMTFSWAELPCKDRNGSNIGYSYQLVNGSSSVLNASVTSALTVTFKSLDPYTTYNFRIAFTNDEGTGPYTPDVTARTSEETPGQVTSVNVEVSSTTLKLLWDPPAAPNGLIRSYTVGYRLNGYGPNSQCSVASMAWTLQNISVPALEHTFSACPYCLYDAKVQAVNGAGTGAEKILTDVLTNATAPTVSPLEPKVDNKTSRQINFTWGEMPCQYRNGPFVSYIYRLQSVGKDVKLDNAASLTATITALVPYTTYEFQVAYRNQAGQGPYGNSVSVRTDEDVPPAPGIVEIATSLTTITVRIDPPVPPHGVIKMYTLEIRERETTDPGDSEDIGPTDFIHTFSSLTRYTTYIIKAKAETNTGFGNWSEEISVITTEKVPGPPNTIAVAKSTATSFQLKWTPPKYNNGILKDYKMICVPTFSYDATVNQDKEKYSLEMEPAPDVEERIIEGLITATEYNCSVAAQTAKGYGPSVWIQVWTEPENRNIPNNLFPDIQLDKTSDTTITVDVKKMPKSLKSGLVRTVRIGVEKQGMGRLKRSTQLTREEHSQMTDYKTAKASGYMMLYIAAELNSTYTGVFIIGDGKTYRGYTNPPLETGQKYDVIFGMVLTAGGATTTSYSRFGKAIVVGSATRDVPVGQAVGIPIGCFILVAIPISIGVVKWRKQRSRAKRDPQSLPRLDDPAPRPGLSIPLHDVNGSDDDISAAITPIDVKGHVGLPSDAARMTTENTEEDAYLKPTDSRKQEYLDVPPDNPKIADTVPPGVAPSEKNQPTQYSYAYGHIPQVNRHEGLQNPAFHD